MMILDNSEPNYQLQSDPPMYVREFNTGKNADKIDELLRSVEAIIKPK